MAFDAEHKKSSQAIRSLRRRGGARPAVCGRPPRVAKRSQRFAKSPRVRAPKARNKQHPRWGRCLFGTGGGARTHTVSPPADFESATSTIPSHRHTVEKYISSTAKFQVFSFSFLCIRRGRHFGLCYEPQVHVCRLGDSGHGFGKAVLPHVTRIIEIGEAALWQGNQNS